MSDGHDHDEKTTSECSSNVEKPKIECSEELPTAGKCRECGTTAVFVNGEGSITCDRCGEVWKAVRRTDAESYADDQFLLGEKMERQWMRQRVLDLIDQRIEEVEINPVDEKVAKEVSKELQELREEVEQEK